MPLFVVPEDNNDIINNPNSFSGTSSPGYNASYVGQTMGPGGMGMSAYMDRPETEPRYTGYDYRPGYDTNTYNLGQTDGPVGMGMSAYMDRPGPMPTPSFEIDYFDKILRRNPRSQGQGIETLQTNVDPSDLRVIQQIMGAGGNPDDYIETADSYSPINLIQMLMDAQDAGDDDLIELLQGDLEMMYPSLV